MLIQIRHFLRGSHGLLKMEKYEFELNSRPGMTEMNVLKC